MNTFENSREQSSFVKLGHVAQPYHSRRPPKRLGGILRAETVRYSSQPVELGAKAADIQLEPIMTDGQIKALRVTCSCGCQSTFDIQYAAGGTAP